VTDPTPHIERLDTMEERAILNALTLLAGNREQAAKALGISERTLYRKIKGFAARGAVIPRSTSPRHDRPHPCLPSAESAS
jgi:DNA-binding NtrC family response regulator